MITTNIFYSQLFVYNINNLKHLFPDEEDETLIVVTGDHSHSFTITGYPKRGNPIEGSFLISRKTNFLYENYFYTYFL